MVRLIKIIAIEEVVVWVLQKEGAIKEILTDESGWGEWRVFAVNLVWGCYYEKYCKGIST